MDDAQPHQGRKTDRRPAVVGEGEKGAAIGDESAMQREAIHRGGHAVLADAVVDVVAGERATRDRSLRLGVREVRMRQVRRAADQSGNCPGNAVEHLLRGLPRRQLRTLAGKALAQFRRGLGIGLRQGNGLALDEQLALRGRRAFVAVEPGKTLDLPALSDHPPCLEDRDRHHEGLIVPAERPARRRCLLGAERRAMRLLGALAVRRAIADDGAAGDQRRSCRSRALRQSPAQPLRGRGRRHGGPTSRTPQSARADHRKWPARSARRWRCRCRRTARSGGRAGDDRRARSPPG